MAPSFNGESAGSLGMSTHVAVHVELPAVIDAAQAALLVAREEQGRAAMAAIGVEQSDAARAVAEGDEVLAQEPHADGRAVALRQLARERRGLPIAPEQLARRRAGRDPDQAFVLLGTQHGEAPSCDRRARLAEAPPAA